MSVELDSGGAQLICSVRDGAELTGCLVMDSLVGGRSCGGLRMVPEIDEGEMRRLASNMTLKFGFLGVPRGGAKAAVRGDPEAPREERWARLAQFGQAIAPLLQHHVFSCGADAGTEPADIRHMLEAVGVSAERRWSDIVPPGYYPALTVITGARAAARHLGIDLGGLTAAVEGWGKVGTAMGRFLDEVGTRVVAISTSRGAIYDPQGLDVKRLLELARQHGSRVVELYEGAQHIELDALLELPVDLLSPCAKEDSVHAGNVERIKARMVCSGANNAVTLEADRALFARGVLCLPDFVTNCGNILGSAMEVAWMSTEHTTAFIQRYVGESIRRLLEEAAARHVPPRDVAIPFALRRFQQMRRKAARPTISDHLVGLGVELNRRGLVPGPIVAAVSRRYFERLVAQLNQPEAA